MIGIIHIVIDFVNQISFAAIIIEDGCRMLNVDLHDGMRRERLTKTESHYSVSELASVSQEPHKSDAIS